ncbi:unnamed protein product [Polarella glacialis]|uniref:Uncharacterized protein n=1 Tax=Polarella glacialis TaxID=89957 RepID=A0A813DBN2_POLGL|nr:unnamed protein product [Polarella glacialis]
MHQGPTRHWFRRPLARKRRLELHRQQQCSNGPICCCADIGDLVGGGYGEVQSCREATVPLRNVNICRAARIPWLMRPHRQEQARSLELSLDACLLHTEREHSITYFVMAYSFVAACDTATAVVTSAVEYRVAERAPIAGALVHAQPIFHFGDKLSSRDGLSLSLRNEEPERMVKELSQKAGSHQGHWRQHHDGRFSGPPQGSNSRARRLVPLMAGSEQNCQAIAACSPPLY